MAFSSLSLTSRVFYVLAWFGILAGLVLCLTLGYWRLAPYEGLTDVQQPFKVSQTVVPKGSHIIYTVSYCVDAALPLPITVHRSMELQNTDPNASLGVLPIAPPVEYEISQRCESRDFFVGLPMYVPTGKYHIHTNTILQVNPVRVIRQSWVSDIFEVVPNSRTNAEFDDIVVIPSTKATPYTPKR